MRKCGDCQLCCKLLPVVGIHKVANEKCKFQKFHKGCMIYNSSKMPIECTIWNCRWLINDDTEELQRPDRTHYVIDIMPATVLVKDENENEMYEIVAVQVWCDPNYPEAFKDPKLLEYLIRRAHKNDMFTIIRFNSCDGILLTAPMNSKEKWQAMKFNDAGKTIESKLTKIEF